MYNTYARFLKHVSQTDIQKSFEVLAVEYQKTKNPKLFMAAYIKGFKIIHNMTKNERFDKVDLEDKVSIVLEQLDKCMRTFQINTYKTRPGFKTNLPCKQFLTYFLFCLNTSLSTCARMLSLNKKGSGKKPLSLDQLKEDLSFDIPVFMDFDEYETNLKLPETLSRNEFLYCWAVLNGLSDDKVSNSCMADILEVSNTMIYNLKKRLRDKFLDASICL